MMYGICDLIDQDNFEKGSAIVSIYTVGLQGVKGFNEQFENILNI